MRHSVKITNNYLKDLSIKNEKISKAIQNNLSKKRILQLWSQFIRLRDNYRCIICDDTNGISAHHICRKSFIPSAQFETGNGVTLCKDCHKEAHQGFNGRPNLNLPMDAQGGEKIEIMSELFEELVNNANSRGLICDEFYFLSDNTLAILKRFQGYDAYSSFPGKRIEQANLIWKGAPINIINEILEANGFPKQELSPLSHDFRIFYD